MNIYGAPYPIVKHPRGYLHTQRGIDQIKADLLVLLLTNPSERCMLPEFGTPLRRLVFEPNDNTLKIQAREMIIKAIEKWEPRVVIQEISVTSGYDEDQNPDDLQEDLDYILNIKIKFFDPENIQAVQTLTLQLPLSNSLNEIPGSNTLNLAREQEVQNEI